MKRILIFGTCVLMGLGLFSSCEIDGDTEYTVSNGTGHGVVVHEYNGNGDEVQKHEVLWDETFRADPTARKVLVSYVYDGRYEYWNKQVYQLQRGKNIIITLTEQGWWMEKPEIK